MKIFVKIMTLLIFISALAITSCGGAGGSTSGGGGVTGSGDPVIIIDEISGVTPPAFNQTPVTAISETSQYTGTVTWSGSPVKFAGSTVYTATITLSAKTGYSLTNVDANYFKVAGATTVTNSIHSCIITAVFPATLTAPPTTINIATVAGVTAPVPGATPKTTITSTTQYTGIITWSGSPVTFTGSTVYTATINLTAKTGYTLTGVAENYFSVTGATTTTNPVNSGVITAVFPATGVSINTIVGILGTSGISGDGVSAASAKLNDPEEVFVDSSGNIFISDSLNHVIRKVDVADGKIYTVAGIPGASGASGDGGLATSAKLNNPTGVFVDSSGNIFITDMLNNAIRKVNASDGKINTVAGTLGSYGTSGDGGLATAAKLYYPTDVFVDASGNIFITDMRNNAIRKVNASDGKINTVVGILGSAGAGGDGGLATAATLHYPQGVFVDTSGNIFISDSQNHAIRKVNASDGKINTVAGTLGTSGTSGDGGFATAAKLSVPVGIRVDFDGNIIFADSMNEAIRKVNASDGKINTIAGTLGSYGASGNGGLATAAKLLSPHGIFIDSTGDIYIAEYGNHAIRKLH